VTALASDGEYGHDSKGSIYPDDRVWYDQFTSTDWVHDSIADAYRLKALRSRKDLRGRLYAFFDGSQGWILSALVGCITATIAYLVDISEPPVFDLKEGYCSDGWYRSERVCLAMTRACMCLANNLMYRVAVLVESVVPHGDPGLRSSKHQQLKLDGWSFLFTFALS
jgi:hypothetical protein